MRWLPLLVMCLAGCGEPEETAVLDIQPRSNAIKDLPTDLGYAMKVNEAHLALRRAAFVGFDGKVHGETEDEMSLRFRMYTAAAGSLVLDVGDYRSARFTFGTRAAGLDEALIGHVAYVQGTASEVPFEAFIDAGDDIVIDLRFEHTVTPTPDEGIDWISVDFSNQDPELGGTLFDGIDFAALPRRGDVIEIRAGSAAHDLLRDRLFRAARFSVAMRWGLSTF